MNTSIRNNIIEHLKKKGGYDPEVDNYIIDELIENITLSKECLVTLKKDGVIQRYKTSSGSEMTKMNPLVGIYQMFQRNVAQLSTKLGINRKDRLMLKLIEEKEKDAFDKDFN